MPISQSALLLQGDLFLGEMQRPGLLSEGQVTSFFRLQSSPYGPNSKGVVAIRFQTRKLVFIPRQRRTVAGYSLDTFRGTH